MPTGILDNVDLIVYDKDLQKDDIIIMCTDGIIDSNQEYENKELWLKYMLEEINNNDVQKIADIIISEAIDNDFGKEKDDSFRGSIGNIYQSFGGQDLYPSLEEKAAHLLYFVTKNHSFLDGNKRIAATMFLYFLELFLYLQLGFQTLLHKQILL